MWAWTTILNVLCTLLPIITFASPATIFLPLLLNQTFDTNHAIEMPPLALTTQMLQCFLFAIYAHHMSMPTLFLPNIAGFLLGFVWATIYPFKVMTSDNGSSSRLRQQWRNQYSVSILLCLLGALTVHTLPYISSTIAAAVGVLMCTYPLPSMRQAYRDNNSNLMGSSVMNLTMFATCLAWVVHSSWLVEYDVFVLVSNGSGVVVQGGALVMRVIIARRTQHHGSVRQTENAEVSVSTPLMP